MENQIHLSLSVAAPGPAESFEYVAAAFLQTHAVTSPETSGAGRLRHHARLDAPSDVELDMGG